MELLTYDEYVSMGGTAELTAFSNVYYDVASKLNYVTSGRIAKLDIVPEQIKRLVFKLINVYVKNNADDSKVVTSYSNGIESFGYAVSDKATNGSTSFDGKVNSIIKEYLFDFPELLYRGNANDS